MGLFKSIGNAVAKPFKDVGKAIHWTSWGPAALSAVGGGVVGFGAYYMNQQAKIAREQIKAQYSLASQQAEDIAQAQVMPVVQTAPQISQSTELADSNTAADNRRRYSLQRTVNNYSLRSSLGLGGGNKYSLG